MYIWGLSKLWKDEQSTKSDDDDIQTGGLFGRDALLFQTSNQIIEDDTDTDESTPEIVQRGILNFDNMATKSATTPKTTTTTAPTKVAPEPKPVATPTTEPAPAQEGGADPASHVYEGAKGVWAWGKGVFVVSPFLGLAEGVANTVIGVAGTNLQEIDGHLKPHISNLDNGLLNPAISAVVGVVLGAAGKTEEIVKPIVITLLSPFGLIKNEPENPEVTAAPPAPATTTK